MREKFQASLRDAHHIPLFPALEAPSYLQMPLRGIPFALALHVACSFVPLRLLLRQTRPTDKVVFTWTLEAAPFKSIYSQVFQQFEVLRLSERLFHFTRSSLCRRGFWNHRLPEPQWSCGGHATERSGEVALVGEPTFGGDLSQRPVGLA